MPGMAATALMLAVTLAATSAALVAQSQTAAPHDTVAVPLLDCGMYSHKVGDEIGKTKKGNDESGGTLEAD